MAPSRQWAWIACTMLIVAGGLRAAGNAPTPAPNTIKQQPSLMLAKLAASQKVVDGLVSKDFDEITRGAKDLARICDAEEWITRRDQVYSHHRTELRRQAHKLLKMAQEKNLDGAAFTYMHSLTTCISCHEYCRDVLRIASDQRPKYKIVPIPVNEEVEVGTGATPVRR